MLVRAIKSTLAPVHKPVQSGRVPFRSLPDGRGGFQEAAAPAVSFGAEVGYPDSGPDHLRQDGRGCHPGRVGQILGSCV
jgi:hypothetical protein